ncbi:MAG: cytochrome P450 [Saprospiraceae bacterium]
MPKLFGLPKIPIPGPKTLPLIGTPMKLFQFLEDPVGIVFNLRQYGDVAAVIADNPALVAVFGPENNKEILSNPHLFQHDEQIFTGPQGSQLNNLRHAIIAINGDNHRKHRRLMVPAFSRAALEGYSSEITDLTTYLISQWPVGTTVRMDSLLRELALCIAVQCFYGLDARDGATELGKLAAGMVETLTDPLTILTPYNIPGTPYHRAVNLAESLMNKLSVLVDEKRANGPGGKDALSLLIQSSDEDGSALSNEELIAEATTLFIAGHETMAMTLSWTLFLLERHPLELERVLDEIETVLEDRIPTLTDLPHMPHTERVIKESMRILAPVPLLFLRTCSSELNVAGIKMPVGANIVVSPLAAHHDKNVFPEPERFIPDRWINLTPPPYTYMPYGGGPRTCIGSIFANNALRLILPLVLRKYRYTIQENSDVSRLTRANILLAKKGIWMNIRPFDREMHKPPPITGDIGELVAFN